MWPLSSAFVLLVLLQLVLLRVVSGLILSRYIISRISMWMFFRSGNPEIMIQSLL